MQKIDAICLDQSKKYILDEIQSCYGSIIQNIILLESPLDKNSNFLYKKINRIDKDISFLKILLDTLGWPENQLNKFQSMCKYYKQTRKLAGDAIYKLFNEQKVSIKYVLEDLFIQLSQKLSLIDSRQNTYNDFQELDILFCLVVDELREGLRSKELSNCEYNIWIDKLNAAKNYVKKIYI